MNQYRLKYKELANYSREVGTILASGLSLIRTFSIMVRREDNKKIKKIVITKDAILKKSKPLVIQASESEKSA